MRSLTLCGSVFLGLCLGLIDTSHASEGCYDAGVVCKDKKNALGQLTAVVDANCPPKAMTVVEHLRRVARQSLPPYVEKAVETLGSASSLHLRARITLSSEETDDRPVAGVYEYWEQNGKYRIRFGIDLAEVPVSEIAYDGRQYQMALGRASTLSVAHADERVVSSEIPNPLVLVLQPLSVATSDCSFCELRLSDLRTLRDLRHAVATGKSSAAPLDTTGLSMKMTRTSSGSPATSVLSKDKLGLVERTEFSDYRTLAGADMDLPRFIRFSRTVNTEGLATRVAIQYEIDELDLNRHIDDSVFILDRSPYETIWQDDRFLRAPHCSKSPAVQ